MNGDDDKPKMEDCGSGWSLPEGKVTDQCHLSVIPSHVRRGSPKEDTVKLIASETSCRRRSMLQDTRKPQQTWYLDNDRCIEPLTPLPHTRTAWLFRTRVLPRDRELSAQEAERNGGTMTVLPNMGAQ